MYVRVVLHTNQSKRKDVIKFYVFKLNVTLCAAKVVYLRHGTHTSQAQITTSVTCCQETDVRARKYIYAYMRIPNFFIREPSTVYPSHPTRQPKGTAVAYSYNVVGCVLSTKRDIHRPHPYP